LLRAWFWACCFSLALSSIPSALAGPHDPHSLDYRGYDAMLRSAVAKEWPEGPDWLWLKGQIYQESAFDRFAVSPVGAQGLCQAMPATAADWKKNWFPKNVWGEISPFDARFCIIGAAKYMRQLQRWKDWRSWPIADRHPMGLAAYNAGMGWIGKARQKCAASDWGSTAPCLASFTGKANAKQTIDYVARITRWHRELLALPAWLDVPCRWRDHRGGCGPAR
jgi:membrane-bound lytic murein transglycosylase F